MFTNNFVKLWEVLSKQLKRIYLFTIMYVRKVGVFKMAKSRKNKKTRRMLLFGTTSIVTIGFLTFTIGGYWVEIIHKYQEKRNLEEKLVQLKEQEAALKVDVEKLQDPDYIARYAREKYLYSKDGEFIIRIP